MNLLKKTDYNAKITEIENKIPNISNLVKKKIQIKITEIEKKKLTDHNHDKYIITPVLNNLTVESLTARLKQVNLVTKTDFHGKLKSLNQKIDLNKKKITFAEYELKKHLITFDYKHLIQYILEGKVILKKMAHKII